MIQAKLKKQITDKDAIKLFDLIETANVPDEVKIIIIRELLSSLDMKALIYSVIILKFLKENNYITFI